jgi:hypothetical protein
VYPFWESLRVLKVLSAFSVNLTINLEPIYGIVLALIFFPETEKMTVGFYIGTLLILISVFAHPVIERVKKRRPAKGA